MLVPDTSGSRDVPVVLLVEDHSDTRQMYAEFLGASYHVMQAGDGKAALDIMHDRLPAVVITDLSLPGVDGFELVRRMRGDPTTQEVPVICLSGYGDRAHEQQARDAGCDRLLQKPCLPDVLVRLIEELVRERRTHA